MSEKQASPMGVGILTVLTILLVLTLAVFSVLTFTAARGDLALSHISANTVSAYYAADAEAQRQKTAFMAGTAATFEAAIPMTDTQNLHIQLARRPDGSCHILAWNTVPTVEAESPETPSLPVWNGGSSS